MSVDAFDIRLTGHPCTVAALKLTPLVFVRPGELRTAEWAEIDLIAAEWRIPGRKMKMKNDHIVPLCKQAVELLRSVHPISGHGRFVFPSMRTGERPMSENTINAALRGMGYSKDVHTAHGFRATEPIGSHRGPGGSGGGSAQKWSWVDDAMTIRVGYQVMLAPGLCWDASVGPTYGAMPPRCRRPMVQSWASNVHAFLARRCVA